MNETKLFDAHLHIIDPRFPLIPNNGYLPEPFTCKDYLDRLTSYNVIGGAIVSGSFQGFDQSYLLSALQELGPSYVGVINLRADATDEEILKLNAAGVRAVRFNLMRGGSEDLEQLEAMANHINELCGWHVELYVDSGKLTQLFDRLVCLPAISIDHLGMGKTGVSTLLRLVEKGAHVKASGFSRINIDVIKLMKQIYSIDPRSLMFGSDLPSTRAPQQFNDDDVTMILNSFNDEQVKNIFYNNALAFYKINHSKLS